MPKNAFGQEVGERIEGYAPPLLPSATSIKGQYCTLEKLSDKHFDDLYKNVYGPETPDEKWTYLPIEKFRTKEEFAIYFESLRTSEDPYCWAIVDHEKQEALGCFSLMRINVKQSSIEVGSVVYSEALKQTRMATEAQFLLAQYVFEQLHYRRYEWKCDDLNIPSRKAALRLGFTYEGTFRQALVYKGRNRDTAWFSMLDKEWPRLKEAFERWLSDRNFDEQGRQLSPLRPLD
ncbi:GNAT family N-acetyltransferase [Saccharibacillus sp. O16]|nr:GNAT family N-acetyltransferase [Saccharibacillus sp. O16]